MPKATDTSPTYSKTNTEQASKLWEETLEELRGLVSKPSYDTWLTPTEAISFEDNKLVISTPNKLAQEWLEERYSNFIKDALIKLTGQNTSILFIINSEGDSKVGSVAEATPQEIKRYEEELADTVSSYSKGTYDEQINNKDVYNTGPSSDTWESRLNPKYTFDTFVIGSANRFAHAASLAVAESPAKAYNPLFIYGGVGLGKTHLMHAIGNYVQKKKTNNRVVYISSEKFTNEFINAILDNNSSAFRNKYREADVLLIDDIQFLAKKEQTQEEFFHTFNALHESDKQIVISSDRPPKEIPTLEERLRSRFEWGLITDIYPPDLETRIAILRKKSIADSLDVVDEVLAFIAGKVDTNIRELEGALIRVVAYSAMVNQPICKELASEALKSVIDIHKPHSISLINIQNAVCNFYNISTTDMNSKKRSKNIALPRQIAMYLCRELTDSSLPKIGDNFGGRDHSTVLHAHDKISKSLTNDVELQEVIKELNAKITGVNPPDNF